MRIQAEEKGTEICDRLSRIWPRTGGGWAGVGGGVVGGRDQLSGVTQREQVEP